MPVHPVGWVLVDHHKVQSLPIPVAQVLLDKRIGRIIGDGKFKFEIEPGAAFRSSAVYQLAVHQSQQLGQSLDVAPAAQASSLVQTQLPSARAVISSKSTK